VTVTLVIELRLLQLDPLHRLWWILWALHGQWDLNVIQGTKRRQ